MVNEVALAAFANDENDEAGLVDPRQRIYCVDADGVVLYLGIDALQAHEVFLDASRDTNVDEIYLLVNGRVVMHASASYARPSARDQPLAHHPQHEDDRPGTRLD